MSDPRDPDLLAALREGRASAFEELMRRHNRLLFRAALGIVRDAAEAQDVVQEAWLHAFQGLGAFRGEASLATWLTRIAINQALAHQRKRGRLVPWDEETEADGLHYADAVGLEEARTPEDEVARLQLRRQLEEAVDRLPPIYRSVFILRAVHGLDVEDTALGLEVSQDVVRTRYARARAMLRARLCVDAPSEAAFLHDVAGARCDAAVAMVLAELRRRGIVLAS